MNEKYLFMKYLKPLQLLKLKYSKVFPSQIILLNFNQLGVCHYLNTNL